MSAFDRLEELIRAAAHAAMPPTKLGPDVEAEGIKCGCGGFADRVKSTAEERERYGCGRDSEKRDCCARAYVCAVCGARHAFRGDAPELDAF